MLKAISACEVDVLPRWMGEEVRNCAGDGIGFLDKVVDVAGGGLEVVDRDEGGWTHVRGARGVGEKTRVPDIRNSARGVGEGEVEGSGGGEGGGVLDDGAPACS